MNFFFCSLTSCLASKVKITRRGVKEVVKSIRKNEKGYRFDIRFVIARVLVLAANISPIDVISHLPVLAEENGIPYVFVSTKEALGEAATTKRPTSCIHIVRKDDFSEKKKYDEVFDEVKQLDVSL